MEQAGTPENIEWCFLALADMQKSGRVTPDMISVAGLQGSLAHQGGKGLIHLLVFKRELHGYLLDEYMPRKNIPAACKAGIREACSSFRTFRAKVGFKNTGVGHAPWRAGWPASADVHAGTDRGQRVFHGA